MAHNEPSAASASADAESGGSRATSANDGAPPSSTGTKRSKGTGSGGASGGGGTLAPSAPHMLGSSLTIADVLTQYQADGRTYTCRASSSLYEAVALMVASRVGCLVAMEEDGEHVAGLVTERDILSEMVRLQEAHETAKTEEQRTHGQGSAKTAADGHTVAPPSSGDSMSDSASASCAAAPDWSKTPVSSAMTRSREMVHCRPGDLIDDALTLMTSQGFRHLPVLDAEGVGASSAAPFLRGMVSMRNLVDVLYKHRGAGTKAQFLNDVLPRTGVPKHTRALRKRRGGSDPNAPGNALEDDPPRPSLYLNAGVFARPHPDKKVGEDSFLAMVGNANTSVDAHGAPVMAASSSPASSSSSENDEPVVTPFSILAVFDGVGSWSFEKGLDYPARFSNALAEGLHEYIRTQPALKSNRSVPNTAVSEALANAADPAASPAVAAAASAAVSPSASGTAFVPGALSAPALSPSAMLGSAWSRVTKDKVAGSSTACILSLAHHSNELRAANIGDSGFVVLRQRDAARVGSVGASRAAASSPWQVVYRSPQQLHYFNCPLQIGVSPSGQTDQFETPLDADVLSVPLHAGDVIILATDGLFDNVPEESMLDEFARAMEELEEKEEAAAAAAAAAEGGSGAAASARSSLVMSTPNSAVPLRQGASSPLAPVASALGQLALRLSLDKMTDSPFAILAKDNGILWKNGGRKDDITVIVARVDPVAVQQQQSSQQQQQQKQ